MNPLLTVHENILHSARMRLPAFLPQAEKMRLTEAVIDSLGLTAKRDTVVGDLGGRSALSGKQLFCYLYRTKSVVLLQYY